MKNRYGKEYWFDKVDDNTYRFCMEEGAAAYMRFGGREGQSEMDLNDLGMFDPPGGPYVAVGSKIYWDEILGGKKGDSPLFVKRIRSNETGIYVGVE